MSGQPFASRRENYWSGSRTCAAVLREDGPGQVLEFRPEASYLKTILRQPAEKLEGLGQECAKMPEDRHFAVRRWAPASTP